MKIADKTRNTVNSFLKELNNEDFKAARHCVNDDLQFIGVMGSRDGADAYFADMEKMKFKYAIQKIFTDGDDACVFYDIDTGDKTIFSCGWYTLKDKKISTIKVLFDPRPLLEEKK